MRLAFPRVLFVTLQPQYLAYYTVVASQRIVLEAGVWRLILPVRSRLETAWLQGLEEWHPCRRGTLVPRRIPKLWELAPPLQLQHYCAP